MGPAYPMGKGRDTTGVIIVISLCQDGCECRRIAKIMKERGTYSATECQITLALRAERSVAKKISDQAYSDCVKRQYREADLNCNDSDYKFDFMVNGHHLDIKSTDLHITTPPSFCHPRLITNKLSDGVKYVLVESDEALGAYQERYDNQDLKLTIHGFVPSDDPDLRWEKDRKWYSCTQNKLYDFKQLL